MEVHHQHILRQAPDAAKNGPIISGSLYVITNYLKYDKE